MALCMICDTELPEKGDDVQCCKCSVQYMNYSDFEAKNTIYDYGFIVKKAACTTWGTVVLGENKGEFKSMFNNPWTDKCISTNRNKHRDNRKVAHG